MTFLICMVFSIIPYCGPIVAIAPQKTRNFGAIRGVVIHLMFMSIKLLLVTDARAYVTGPRMNALSMPH